MAFGIIAPGMLGLDAPAQPATSNPASFNPATFNLAGGGVVPAARQADHVVVVPIQGRLDRFQTASVMRRLAQAKEVGANAIVLEIDSRQSNYGTVSELLSVIRQSPVANIVAWIHDAEGARSGGSTIRGGAGLVALACREIVVGGNASIGELIDPEWLNSARSARGRRASPSPAVGPAGGIERFADVAAPAISSAIESARRRGWDEFLVQAMAVPGVELWLVENITSGERLCINEREHAVLFPTPPGRAGVELSSAKAASPFEAAMARAGGVAGTSPTGWSGASGSSGVGANPIPASAGVASLLASQPVSTIESPSTRPVFTSADAGKWRVEVYASDGAGSVTLQGKQMARFGLAKATVNDDPELSAYFGAKKITRLDQSWAEHAARFLSNPFVRGLLISIFMISMFIEMTHPGMVVPGLIAAAALALVLGPNFIMGLANWWSLGAVGVGILLLALELFVIPGFGIAGIFGLITLFVGLVFTFVPGGPGGMAFSTAEAQDSLARGAVTVLLSTLTAIFGIFFVVRQLGTLPIMKKYTLQSPAPGEVDEALFGAIRPREEPLLPGDIGMTGTLLRPSGKATFEGEVFDVVAQSGFIPEGVQVQVVSADRFRVVVELAGGPESGSAPDPSSTAT